MIKPESLGDRLSGLKLQLRNGTGRVRRRRRADRRWRFAAEISGLEERCLMSKGLVAHPHVKGPRVVNQTAIYVANPDGTPGAKPYTLTNPASGASAVMFLGGTSPLTGDINWGTVPTEVRYIHK